MARKKQETKKAKETKELTKEEAKAVEEVIEEIKETVAEELPTITLDNRPVSPLINKEDEEIPVNFVKQETKAVYNSKAKHNVYNGRIYKVLNNGRGMYADNGETFDLSQIK